MGCSNCHKEKFPTSSRLAVTAAGAGARVVRAALAGQRIKVSPAVEQSRLATCRACQEVSVKEQNGITYHRCQRCGCWLDGKYLAKARIATEACPLGKWEATA